jgi:DNA-binding LacI/PurR family transcriptional regulator
MTDVPLEAEDARPPTIDDVVRLAGVGKGTVSRVLNGSASVSEATRARVRLAIQELNFRPNVAARRLSQGTATRQIGVLESFITSPAFADRLRGIQDIVESTEDFELLLFSCGSPERYARRLSTIVEQRSVEGLLIVDLLVSEEQSRQIEAAGIAVVSISSDRQAWPSLGPDDFHGGYLATRHLIDRGHRRIGYVGDAFPDPFGFTTGRDRFRGYERALEEAGLPVDPGWIGLGKHGKAEASDLTCRILAASAPPTAIFAMSDIQAIGCMAAAQGLGASVPNDVSIIGFDDIEISTVVGLTTVRQHLSESGRIGARYLLQRLRGERAATIGALPTLEVIERRSTAPPRN